MSRFIYATQDPDGRWHAAIEPWEGIGWSSNSLEDVLDQARKYLEAIDGGLGTHP